MTTKLCRKCDTDKPLDQFNKNKAKNDGLQSMCRGCSRANGKSHFDRNKGYYRDKARERSGRMRPVVRQWLYDYLKVNPCSCGESDPAALEFDHTDPAMKKYTIATMATRGVSLDTVKAEVAKCQVLCANCHRKRTAKQFGWYADVKK